MKLKRYFVHFTRLFDDGRAEYAVTQVNHSEEMESMADWLRDIEGPRLRDDKAFRISDIWTEVKEETFEEAMSRTMNNL